MCCVREKRKKKLSLNEGMRNGEKFSHGNSSLSRYRGFISAFPQIVKLLSFFFFFGRKQTATIVDCVIPFGKICFHVSNINVTKCETKKFTIRRDLFTTIQSL